ncbi:hypothetical protein P8452_46908 [Trifolium repens]|nr:hypothetical protein P8452_46908 [Trifolium repens]
MQPIGNPHSALIVPPVTVNRNEPIQEINSHSTNQAMITVPQQSMLFIPQSLPNNNLSPTPSQPNNDQLQHMINTPDNTITAQSFPNNYLAVPSPTFTQNVVESINQPFSFTSPARLVENHLLLRKRTFVELREVVRKACQETCRESSPLEETHICRVARSCEESLPRYEDKNIAGKVAVMFWSSNFLSELDPNAKKATKIGKTKYQHYQWANVAIPSPARKSPNFAQPPKEQHVKQGERTKHPGRQTPTYEASIIPGEQPSTPQNGGGFGSSGFKKT